ncbi:phospholipase D-like domain-containing protein [Candidatus Gracilibacteria bacterium]|nr:phospholipase D-like domain-containing protein [Candidatus Gracilibacteria bacterium]
MKNSAKYFSILFGIIFIIILSFFHGSEYIEFHEEKKSALKHNLEINSQLEAFTLQGIQNIDDIEIYQTPDIGLLDQIVSEINNAKNRVYLETYILTETRIQQALIDSYKKGIDIQVVLEKNPYKAYNINNKSFNNLTSHGVPVFWSDSDDYSFNHAKFSIIDENVYISTGNYSYSTFKYNRDYFLKTSDSDILSNMLEIFIHDASGNKYQIYHPNIILSPFNSRFIFKTFFESAQESIFMYFQYFKDEELVETLISKENDGIHVTAVIPESALDNNKDVLEKMSNAGIEFHIMQKNKMHSKMILTDKQYLYIGSINFSSYSLDQNREVGLLIKNPTIINKIINYYQEDIAKNTVKK